MRSEWLAILVLAEGCRGETPPRQPVVSDTSTAAVSPVPASAKVSPGPALSEDSILDSMLPGRTTVMPSGDTLQDFGGGMMDTTYAVSEYRKNDQRYFRIQRILGHKPDGRAIWKFLTRVAVPKLDSAEALMFAGLCGTRAGGADAFLIAVAPQSQDTVFTGIRHAWRFDRSTETLKEIPAADVICWNPGGD